eukprot:2980628-Prymnesium_polylepis.2
MRPRAPAAGRTPSQRAGRARQQWSKARRSSPARAAPPRCSRKRRTRRPRRTATGRLRSCDSTRRPGCKPAVSDVRPVGGGVDFLPKR